MFKLSIKKIDFMGKVHLCIFLKKDVKPGVEYAMITA